MHTDEVELFQCEHCGRTFASALFDICRAMEKVDFTTFIPSVTIDEAEDIARFCSASCRHLARSSVMARSDVPVRRCGIGPVEPCAKCGGPVDMAVFHPTYTESDITISKENGYQPTHVEYLAVLCRNCDPRTTRTIAQPISALSLATE